MKHCYLIAFLFFSSLAFAQQSQSTGDIEGFKLYPNPTTNGKIFIDTTHDAPKQILIFDVLGTKVMETNIVGKELYVGNLDKGVYIMRVSEKAKVATRKLIIK